MLQSPPPASIAVAEMASSNSSTADNSRFLFVDAIRGVAALAVVLRHLFYNPMMGPSLERIFPLPLQQLSIWGAAGVYAFFVLSGFVIAHSLRHSALTKMTVLNFIVRRQFRLDPPYWIAIFLTLSVGLLTHNFGMEQVNWQPPALLNTLVNMFYLQGVLHKNSIIGVAWTLCIEIQFYLVFICILVSGRSSRRLSAEVNVSTIAVALIFIGGAASLLLKHFTFHAAWFFSYWHYFAAGVLGYWAMRKVIPLGVFAIYMGLFALSTVASPLHAINSYGAQHSLSVTGMLVGLVTISALVYAGRHGFMGVWGKQKIFQYGGKISYSLYLIHPVVIHLVWRAAERFDKQNPLIALSAWLCALILSFAAAHLLYLLIEKPSMKISSRLRKVFLPATA